MVQRKQIVLLSLYLLAIIIANLLVTAFGTKVVIPVAFVLVGLDITTRDYLHEVWTKRRWLKLGILIAVGSLLSWLLNKDSATIAIASFVAFASSQILDAVVYTILFKHHRLIKINGSNFFSSLADSAIFLTIAFGSFMPLLILYQFTAKFVGGFIWSLIMHKLSSKKPEVKAL